MKKKELNDSKNKTMAEVDKEINDRRERLLNLRMDLSLGKVKNISEIKELKKSIAQLKGLVRERELRGESRAVTKP
jgi:large subunit ribosomal protein L29